MHAESAKTRQDAAICGLKAGFAEDLKQQQAVYESKIAALLVCNAGQDMVGGRDATTTSTTATSTTTTSTAANLAAQYDQALQKITLLETQLIRIKQVHTHKKVKLTRTRTSRNLALSKRTKVRFHDGSSSTSDSDSDSLSL
jgi:hypothetical protein